MSPFFRYGGDSVKDLGYRLQICVPAFAITDKWNACLQKLQTQTCKNELKAGIYPFGIYVNVTLAFFLFFLII